MAMPKLDFEAVEELQAVGFSPEQGKALVRIIANMQTAQLATKADLIETREILRSELAEVKNELRSEIADVKNELRSEMAALELRLTEKMSALFTKVIIWLVGTAIASVSLMATIGQLVK